MKNINISTKIYLGFGSVLALALLVAGVGYLGLKNAEETFATYRSLARQTNADGRVQANMLMTRIFAKNFVIDANRENINGVKIRAERTLELIREDSKLTGTDAARHALIGDLEENLQRYVAKFDEVTVLQKKRDQLVSKTLNVLGPQIEQDLTAIMTSALKDGDAPAAYQAGITLRSLMLGRLYANRFLIENDEGSRARAIREFRDLEFNHLKLSTQLQNPERKKLARSALINHRKYLEAFDNVHLTIIARNNIIKYELDRIGPDVANRIERLKLAIKREQDTLGPAAEQALTESVIFSAIVSILAIALGLLAAGFIVGGITRPIQRLTSTAVAIGDGDLDQEIDTNRNDEIGVLAKSLAQMRDSITSQVVSLEKENAERRLAETALEKVHENLERTVEERTAELKSARDAAEDATRAKAEFLATMSHEIRTPMNGIIGMIDLLKQTKVSRDQKDMIDTVSTSAYALLTIINDILDYSKIEAGKLELETMPMSVCDVVEGVAETLMPNAHKKGILINSFVDPAIPDAVIGDSVRLRQVLFNLAGNAVKFTTEGNVLIRVDQVSAIAKDEIRLCFKVLDTGIGISEKAQANLFQAFTQAEMSTTRKFGGTGLGLTIAQRIVKIMNGDIAVESELGKGSIFSVTASFPIATDHHIKSDSYDLSGLNILLAVRDPFLNEALPQYLSKCDASVTIQSDFESVVSQVHKAAKEGSPFDILFLENTDMVSRTDIIRAIQSDVNSTSTTFVLQVDQRNAEQEDLKNTIYAPLKLVKRGRFIRSIAVAAGRESPDIEFEEDEIPTVGVKQLSIEEAEAAGTLILLAEDNITNQKVIQRQLNSLGHTVLIANDGEQALKAYDNRSFAVLLTDCHMPNLDGFGLTKKIREREEAEGKGRIPIVAITASVLTAEVEQCYESGMDDFLSKPLEMAKLNVALKKWMPTSERPAEKPSEPISEQASDSNIIQLSSTKQGSEKGPVDLTFLEETFGNETETILEILKEFIEPSQECCLEVENALKEASLKGVIAGAHKLKSSARSIGAIELADICEEMEIAGKDGDWEPVRSLAPKLNNQMGQVVKYINKL